MQNLILNRLASVCNLKNKEQKGLCAPFRFKINLIKFRFLIFFEQFRTAGNSTPGPPKAEKLAGSRGKKIIQLPQEEHFLEAIQKNVISFYNFQNFDQ